MANKLTNSKADFEQWRQKFKDMSDAGSDAPSKSQTSTSFQDDCVVPSTGDELSDVEMKDLSEEHNNVNPIQHLPSRK